MAKAKLVPIPGRPGLFTYENLKRDPKIELKVALQSLEIEFEIRRERTIERWEEKHGELAPEFD